MTRSRISQSRQGDRRRALRPYEPSRKILPPVGYLQSLFVYDPSIGRLRWKIRKKGSRMPAGSIAGTLGRRGYRAVFIDGEFYKEHRVIWKLLTGKEPPPYLDHKNLNRAHNIFDNLRPTSASGNIFHQRRNSRNMSGVTGVFWHRQRHWTQGRYRAQLGTMYLGTFDNFGDAVAARVQAENALYGGNPREVLP